MRLVWLLPRLVVCWLGLAGTWQAATGNCWAQDLAQELSAEEQREKRIIERFQTVLERRPRRGTAFDRIYGHHVEWGTLDQLMQQYRERAAGNDDGTAWLIVGMIESQRGRDAAAVEAFGRAEKLLQDNPIVSYYLGQSLVMVGQPEQAVAAFERAIARRPARADILDIFQALGRVHQRAQRNEQALSVWTRLEQLMPDDPRVQEEIAITLVEEGQPAAALPRYEALVELTDDPYRRSVYRMEAARLKVLTGQAQEAISDFESMLGKLNPDSWLFREVRRQIEEVFLRTDDQDGLAKYYEAWLERHPRDVDVMARLARVLVRQARMPEARRWLEQALERAPSRKELRLAFIDQLVEDQRYAEAIAQFEALDKADPNNPDYLTRWGKLHLQDTQRPKPERLAAAERVWRRLAAARPDDAVVTVQVADLFRHAEMKEPALDFYRRAVELAPAEPQYREYLGEYYHILKRSDEALETWRQIAAGEQRTAENLSRLAEVLATFGYLSEALPEVSAACAMDPHDFALQMQAAGMHARAEQYPAAQDFLAAADRLAANDEERDQVLTELIKTYQLDESLQEKTEQLAAELDGQESPDASRLIVLARYYEALRRHAEAVAAIERAIKVEPESVSSLSTAARLQERSGNLEAAADLNRQLARVDRRFRTDYLTAVARLETQLGRTDQALAAGRELIASAPGNTENYEFFAQLCFRLGRTEEGLTALRRALRVNPTDPQLAITLAAALANQFRTDEAIELYWQAYERASVLDDRLSVVEKLTALYLQTNHLDRLLERLERERRDADERREATICLAQAYQSAGDFGAARQELESLLNEDTRDTQLLQQLSKLAEREGDSDAAIKFQEQLAELAPSSETKYRLANLYNDNSKEEAGSAILLELIAREQDPVKLLRNIDGLLKSKRYEAALEILQTKRREDAKNWEFLYREGVALAAGEPEQAQRSFQTILDLSGPDDQLGAAAQARQRSRRAGRTAAPAAAMSRFRVYQSSYAVRRAAELDPSYSDPFAGGGSRQNFWAPESFGQARMAALAWLYKLAGLQPEREAFLERQRQLVAGPSPPTRAIWDWAYLVQVTNQNRYQAELYKSLRVLAESGDPEAQWMFLTALPRRAIDSQGRTPQPGQPVTAPPLAEEELEFVVQCYQELSRAQTENTNVRAYGRGYLFNIVAAELKRSGRLDQARELYQELVRTAKSPRDYAVLATHAEEQQDWETLYGMLDRWSDEIAKETNAASSRSHSYTFCQLMGRRGEAKAHADVLRIADAYLDASIAAAGQRKTGGPRRRTAGSGNRSTTTFLTSWYGTQRSSNRLQFPLPSTHFDTPVIQVVRNAYDIFQRNDVVSDLIAHFEARAQAAAPGQQHYAHLHLASLYWWEDKQEQAVQQLSLASRALPQDFELRLMVGNLKATRQEYDEALSLIDELTPVDHNTLREREILALDFAVRIGDVDRARKAAERLFGLRLGADEQLALASQMRSLGMNALADAVMNRAQRQAGNQMTALTTLMNQHLSQGNNEIATQVAHRILQRTRPIQPRGSFYTTARMNNDNSRRAALQVLGRTGGLSKLIARSEKQLKASPNSTQLYQQLGELYEAAGDRNKSLELNKTVVKLRPQDGKLRFAFAQQLEQAGKFEEACDQYKRAIALEPRSVINEYYRVVRVFQRAKRTSELGELFQDLDLTALGGYWVVGNVISSLQNEPDQRGIALELIKRAWAAFPNDRMNIMANIHNADMWKMSELQAFVREAFMPAAGAVSRDPWIGLRANSYSSGGTIYGPLYYLLRGQQETSPVLKKMRDDIAAHARQLPQWHAGPALVAVFDAHRGQPESARERLTKLFKEDQTWKSMPADARRVVGQALEPHSELKDLVIRLYEQSMHDANSPFSNQFRYSAGPKLASLYAAAGRRSEARKMFVRWANTPPQSSSSTPGYAEYDRARSLSEIAQQMAKLDFPVDALRMYRQMQQAAETAESKSSRYKSSIDRYLKTTKTSIDKAMNEIAAETLTKATAELLVAPLDDSGRVIDLMLTVGREGQAKQLQSLLFDLLSHHKMSAAAVASLDTQLAELAQQHADSFEVQIAFAHRQMATTTDPPDQTLAAVLALLERAPLEELPAGQRPNARQRQEAERRIGLWLLAEELLADSDQVELGARLANEALAASRRQLDKRAALAIMQRWGQLALQAGQTERAAGLWNEMLDFAVARPTSRSSAADSPAGAARLAPITQSQFKTAIEIARLAAKPLPEVSMRAVRLSLAGGPPIPDAAPTSLRRRPTVVRTPTSQPVEDFSVQIASDLNQVAADWTHAGVPAADVYEVLSSVVFCPSRPGEIQLYAQPISQTRAGNPVSVGATLVATAIKAQQAADLQQRIQAARAQPAAALAGKVLLALLAISTKDTEGAAAQLAALHEQIKAQPLPSNVQLACHAAIPALNQNDELLAVAMPIIDLATASPGPQLNGLEALAQKAARIYLRADDAASAGRQLEKFLQARMTQYSRYSGDYGMYLQQQDLASSAVDAARYHQMGLVLKYLGRVADIPPTSRGAPDLAVPVWHLARHVATLAADERYVTLRDWTLPNQQRRTVRFVAAFNDGQLIPDAVIRNRLRRFDPATNLAVPPQLREDLGALSNLTLLVQAAAEVAALDELIAAGVAAQAEELVGAETLLTLAYIAAGDRTSGEPLVREAMQQAKQRQAGETPSGKSVGVQWQDYVVMQSCLRSPEFNDLGHRFASQLLAHARARFSNPFLTHIGYELARDAARRAGDAHRAGAERLGLRLWHAGTNRYAAASSMAPAWWTSHDNIVVHRSGWEHDRLYFRYPLSGHFEFSFDTFVDHYSAGDLGYGGLVFESQPWANKVEIWSLGSRQRLTRPRAVEAFPRASRRVSVQVSPETVRYLVNNRLVFEEQQADSTSPWLYLVCMNHRQVAFRNGRFTGAPKIPSEVRMSQGDRLDGWVASFFGQSMPPRFDTEQDQQAADEPEAAQQTDWRSEGGVIQGRFHAAAGRGGVQGLLSYDRPLLSGDTVRYEFFYEPDKTLVHPAVGRVAFLLEPTGVRVHWMPGRNETRAHYEIWSRNRVAERASRRERPQLKAGAWNQAELSVQGDQVSLSVNGQLVSQRRMEASNQGQFGLFHYRDRTAVRVRNVVLTGDWPAELTADELSRAFQADEAAQAPELLAARHALAGEEFQTQMPYEVWLKSRQLPAGQRYEQLRQWVLPSHMHPTFRLQAGLLPVDPAAPVRATAWGGLERDSQHRGGDLISPAAELVNTARELDRLDQLAQLVQAAPAASLTAQRSRNALRLLIAVAQGHDQEAGLLLRRQQELAAEIAPDTPQYQRYPEAVAVAAALDRPALAAGARKLAESLVEQQRQNSVSPDWELLVRCLQAQARWKTGPATAQLQLGSAPQLSQWRPVNYLLSEQRGRGAPPGGWHAARGQVEHYPGNSWDALYFNVPLRGNFEVQFERTTHGWRETEVGYATIAIDPNHDGQSVLRRVVGRKPKRTNIEIPQWSDWVSCRLVIQDGSYTAFINGKQVHQEQLSQPIDPWLYIRTEHPRFQGRVKNLRILGSPEVPEELQLSAGKTLAGWRSDYYGDSIGDKNSDWRKVKQQITGQRMAKADGSHRESVLQYHRPLLEDGELAYEFLYEPGKLAVHPALDRLAFLLRPEGVKLHWMTDGGFDRSGLAPNNEAPLPEGTDLLGDQPVPLLAGRKWNKLQLQLKGRELTLNLNGQDIVRYPLSETNQKLFGLFHYRDATAVRVRNVVYRGQWPQQLPSVEAQELAGDAGQVAANASD